MKLQQQLIGFVFIVVILGAIAFFVNRGEEQQSYENRQSKAEKMFPNITAETAGDKVSQIEITTGGETTVLRQSGTQWLVSNMNDYPADQEEVKTLLEKVDNQKALDLVSKNPGKQTEFEVAVGSDESPLIGVEVKLKGEGEKLLAHFFVGKNTPDFFNAYIRQQGSEKVYIASDLSKSNFDKGTRTWRNRKIFSFNKGDITNVLIELANEVIEMKSGDDNKWQMIQPATSAVKQNTLDTILDNISKFETDDFVSDDSDSSFEAKEKITVTLNDGSKRILLAATEVDGKHWVKRFDQEQLFSIYKYKYNQLFKPADELKDDSPPPNPDEQKITPGAGESDDNG